MIPGINVFLSLDMVFNFKATIPSEQCKKYTKGEIYSIA